MAFKWNREIDLGHLAAVILAIATVAIPAFAAWLTQHDQLQRLDQRITVLEKSSDARDQADEGFRREVRTTLGDIQKDIHQIDEKLINKQDRK